MRNQSLHTYKIATVSMFLISLVLVSEYALADQENSDKWRVSPRLSRIENPITPDTSSLTEGKSLYLRECQQCHGETGKGDGQMAAFLTPKPANLTSPEVLDQSDGAIYTKIRTGKASMPSFKSALAKDGIWHMINFIRVELGTKKASSGTEKKVLNTDTDKSGGKAHDELFKQSQFPSAQECGGCHLQIYREWSVSRHAFSQISPTFLAYQATLVKLTQGTLGDFCERCHTQVGMLDRKSVV